MKDWAFVGWFCLAFTRLSNGSRIPSQRWEPLCKSLSVENRGADRLIYSSTLGTGAFCTPHACAVPGPPASPTRSCWGQEHRPVEGREHSAVDKWWVEQDPGQHLASSTR